MDKIAVIGLGSISDRHRQNIKHLFPQAEVAVLSSSARSLDTLPSHANRIVDTITELIEFKPDFVIDASPSTFHAKYSKEIIEAGIPCLTEKPLTASVYDSDILIGLDNYSRTRSGVGYCLRLLPATNTIKKILENNELGEIYNVQISTGQHLSQWRNKSYLNSVSANKALGGGVLLELSHELDLVQYLLGEMTLKYSNLNSSRQLGLEVEDIADLMLLPKDQGRNFSVYIHLDFLQVRPQRNMVIIAEKGRLEWDVISNTVKLMEDDSDRILYSDDSYDKNSMYLEMVSEFAAGVKLKESRLCTFEQARSVVEIIEQAKLYGEQ